MYTMEVVTSAHIQAPMRFDGKPTILFAKIFWTCLGFLFVRATKKALTQDLDDIKAALEGNPEQVRQPG
jgi:hypothetical protein